MDIFRAIDTLIALDNATKARTWMVYAYISIQVNLEEKFPKTISLVYELGNWVQEIKYESKP